MRLRLRLSNRRCPSKTFSVMNMEDVLRLDCMHLPHIFLEHIVRKRVPIMITDIVAREIDGLDQAIRAGVFVNLKSLRLHCGQLADDAVASLVEPLTQSPQLQQLSVSYSTVGKATTQALALHMPRSPIRHFILEKNHLGDSGVQELVTSLQSVVTLHLIDNDIGETGVEALTKTPFSQLSSLSLDKNMHIGGRVKGLIEALGCHLKDLSLGATGLRDGHVKEFAPTLSSSRIENLSLHHNDIGNEGMVALLDHLPVRLIRLDLHNNCIGTPGVQALTRALRLGALYNLEELDLENNRIGNRGIDGLAMELTHGLLPRCHSVRVQGNPSTYDVTLRVSHALKRRRMRSDDDLDCATTMLALRCAEDQSADCSQIPRPSANPRNEA